MKEIITKVFQRIQQESTYSKDKSDKHGEVFTPAELINEMIDKLPVDVWKDKTKTFFDPCAGKGNFPIQIIERLYTHLEEEIPNEEERLRHIVENQIYMAEFQEASCKFVRTIFSFGRGYKVNLYCGDTLKMPTDFFDLTYEERFEKYPEHCC